MKADINVTFAALNSYFLNTATMKINEEYLNHLLNIQCFNIRRNYSDMKNKRRKSHAIVWQAFIDLANDDIKEMEEPRQTHIATNYHLKKWLETYGRGLDSIAETVEAVETYRKEELF